MDLLPTPWETLTRQEETQQLKLTGDISTWCEMSQLHWLQTQLCHCILAEDVVCRPWALQLDNLSFRQSFNDISYVFTGEDMKISACKPAGNPCFYKHEFITEWLKWSAEFWTDPFIRNYITWNMLQNQLCQGSSQERLKCETQGWKNSISRDLISQEE